MNNETVVAWVSRHPPLPAQIEKLYEMYGDRIKIIEFPQTFKDAKVIIAELKRRNVTKAVVVAPLSMISVLLQEAPEIEWLRAEMKTLHKCDITKCDVFDPIQDVWLPLQNERNNNVGRHIRFVHFCRLKEIKIICKPIKEARK